MRGGEGKVKAEFKCWVNFCDNRERELLDFRDFKVHLPSEHFGSSFDGISLAICPYFHPATVLFTWNEVLF